MRCLPHGEEGLFLQFPGRAARRAGPGRSFVGGPATVAQQVALKPVRRCHQLRSLLREYFPAFSEAFKDKQGGLARADARRILAVAPTPALAAKLPIWRLDGHDERAGRRRNIEADAERLQQLFRREAPHQVPLVEEAMG
ncbi:hypothetical protein ACFUJY_22645 [Streptomyces sp. NPDC057249]|uniref:hypothetical protein n=1 Tax=Streptomyces sp. NPDC057249 TaxID=3346067 RepID=UPI00362AD3DA